MTKFSTALEVVMKERGL